jgi:hypothetical protein
MRRNQFNLGRGTKNQWRLMKELVGLGLARSMVSQKFEADREWFFDD